MRFFCEVANRDCLVDAETPDAAARMVAAEQAALDRGAGGQRAGSGAQTYTVTVAEANGADMPLIAGTEYQVTVPPES